MTTEHEEGIKKLKRRIEYKRLPAKNNGVINEK